MAIAAMLAVSCGKGDDDPVKGTPVAKVTLNKTSLDLYKGDAIQLVAEVDLSMNTELDKMVIENTTMDMLDISGCTKLTYLMCSKLEPLAEDTTSVELVYTCGKHVQRYKVSIVM